MATFDDLTGKRFGRLTVICRAPDYVQPNGHHKTQWKCKCDCGNEVISTAGHLKDGHCQSCGCLNSELSAQRLAERDRERAKHGKWNDRLYKIYANILDRCYKVTATHYQEYGGRGVRVCSEWYDPNSTDTINIEKFQNFYNWAIMNGYADNLTIDRIDNNGPYAPWNCRWATDQEQMNNRSVARYTEFNGMRFTVGQLANIFGVNYDSLYNPMSRVNFNVYNLFGYVQTPYGRVFTLTNWRGDPIPIHPVYFIDQYGFPVSCEDYKDPAPKPALWNVDSRGFVTTPLIDDPNEM